MRAGRRKGRHAEIELKLFRTKGPFGCPPRPEGNRPRSCEAEGIRAALHDSEAGFELQERALADAAVRHHTDGKTVRRVVVGKGPLVSVVVQ